jgi:hypothetical protein
MSFTIVRKWLHGNLFVTHTLAAKSMLRNRKMASTLYFGAAIGGNEKLVRLHCWLAHQDTIITGKRGHQDYKVIQVYA